MCKYCDESKVMFEDDEFIGFNGDEVYSESDMSLLDMPVQFVLSYMGDGLFSIDLTDESIYECTDNFKNTVIGLFGKLSKDIRLTFFGDYSQNLDWLMRLGELIAGLGSDIEKEGLKLMSTTFDFKYCPMCGRNL